MNEWVKEREKNFSQKLTSPYVDIVAFSSVSYEVQIMWPKRGLTN